MTDVCVRLRWQPLGLVTVEAGKLVFPSPPAKPGVYRFALPARVDRARSYIGQTDGLPRRFAHYRNPGPSQRTNIRINALMTELLVEGGQVAVLVAVDGELSIASKPIRLDFADKAHRLFAEGAALVSAGAEGVLLDNL